MGKTMRNQRKEVLCTFRAFYICMKIVITALPNYINDKRQCNKECLEQASSHNNETFDDCKLIIIEQ